MTTYPEFARLLEGYLEPPDERTPSWLARRLGMSVAAVTRWLNDETRPGSPETVIRIADILGVHDRAKRQELLAAAGYGYQEGPPATDPVAPPPIPEPLSDLHKEYLRRWFGNPFASVKLADMLEGREEEVSLLDVYVPLRVDLNLIVKAEDDRIVDWWVRHEREEALQEHMPSRQPRNVADRSGEPQADPAPKLRAWTDLGVGESGMQAIVAGIQRKIDRRENAGEKTEDGEHSWYMEAQDAASVQPRFVLLGSPGGGKSSFLRHLTLCLAGELRRRAGDDDVPPSANLASALNDDWLLDAFTPVYVEIRDLVRTAFPPLPPDGEDEAALPTCSDFWRYVRDQVLPGELAAFTGELQRLCAEGKALLLLDGLDEAPQAGDKRRRDQIKALVTALVQTYPKLRIIVTGRPHAYRRGEWALPGFGRAELETLEFGRLRQLAQALFSVVGVEQTEEEAKAFIQAIGDDSIEQTMRGTPLFFTMLAALWLNAPPGDRRLPQSKPDLYRRSVDLLLGRWTRRRAPDPSVADKLGVPPARLRAVLETLACTVQEQYEPGQDTTLFEGNRLATILYDADVRAIPQDVSDYLSQQVGILVAPAPRLFHFMHRSFQEHLAACELTCLNPEQRQPPVADDRRFPAGLIERLLTRPDVWENVLLLATDELMANKREEDLWRLLVALVEPYVVEGTATEAAALAFQATRQQNLFELPAVQSHGLLIDAQHLVRQQGQGALE